MKLKRQTAGILFLLALLLCSLPLYAQEDNTINVGGSGIVTPLFEAFAQAADAAQNVEITVTGTNAGLAEFCDSTLDITLASRSLSADEEANCATNQVEYLELLFAHDILAFITHPENTSIQCLTDLDLNNFYPPSAQGRTNEWAEVDGSTTGAVTLFIPPLTTSTYALLDQLVEGDGIRNDVTILSDAEIITEVAQTPGALGVTSLVEAAKAGDSVQILDLNIQDRTGCNAPSAENVEGRNYDAATRFFLYVNVASLEKTGVSELLAYITDEANAVIVSEQGLTPITSSAYVSDRGILDSMQIGRQFSQEVTAFAIPEGLTGEIVIGGAANAFSYLQALTNLFSSQYAGATATYRVEGEAAGLRRLCNGELDIAITYGDTTDDELAGCEAQNIDLYKLNLGAQSVVVIANDQATFLQNTPDEPFCLTTAALTTLFGAHTGDPIANWNQVDATYPDAALTLFAPAQGDSYSSLLLALSNGIDIPIRDDLEANSDALYRAAAVANVENALTFMSWRDYQRVLIGNQENIQLVGIGENCIQPSPATILSGEYPLAQRAELLISKPALARPEVQSLIWYMLEDQNYSRLENAGFIGVNFGDLPELRSELQREFILAMSAAQAAPSPEVTAEPGAEITPEATPEATPETSG